MGSTVCFYYKIPTLFTPHFAWHAVTLYNIIKRYAVVKSAQGLETLDSHLLDIL